MDAAAQLALMLKAKLVFETPGNFLSFPAFSPLVFKPSDLNFSRAMENTDVISALESFSRAVNVCPAGTISGSDSTDYLWDRYDHWLNTMSFADSALGPDNQSAYAAAQSVLTVTGSDGVVTDSPKVVSYKQHRDDVITAQQAYNSAKLTATASGADALSAWTATDEPQFRAAIDAATADWILTGFKAEVEAAQSTIIRCQAYMPVTIWAQWRKAYNPDIDLVTDPASNATFAPTGFTPADLASESWATLHLTSAEIATLVANAPPELHTLFGDVSISDVESISFEFCSAAIVRPWFAPAMFATRFWKFTDSTQLSDGNSPPAGAWPSYVTAVIFVRNVQVVPVSTSPSTAPHSEQIRWLVRLPQAHQLVNSVAVAPAQPTPAPQVLLTPISHIAPPQHAMLMAHPFVAFHPASALAVSSVKTAPNISYLKAIADTPVTPAPPPANVYNPAPAAKVVAPASLARNALALRRLTLSTYALPASSADNRSSGQSNTQQQGGTQAAPDDHIQILAFICKMLPKSPDPDATLAWPG